MSPMRSLKIRAVFLALGLAVCGCAGLPAPQTAYMRRSLTESPETQVISREEALDALALLKDSRLFPGNNLQDITVTANSVELDGFLRSNSEDMGGYQGAGTATYGYGISSNDSAGTYYGESSQSFNRNTTVIWLTDIQTIRIYQMEEFSLLAQPSEDDYYRVNFEGYLCSLSMTDAPSVTLWSSDATATLRVASAFAWLSGKPVESLEGNAYPPAGCILRGADGVVEDEEIGGAFWSAEIPLGAKITSINGKAFETPQAVIEAVYALEPGTYSIRYLLPYFDGWGSYSYSAAVFGGGGEKDITIAPMGPP